MIQLYLTKIGGFHPPYKTGADRRRILVGWVQPTRDSSIFHINSRSTSDDRSMEPHQVRAPLRSATSPPPAGGKHPQSPLPAPLRAGGRPDVAFDLQRDEHGRQRPRLAPPGDPRLQRRHRRHEHDRFRHPRQRRSDDRAPVRIAPDHPGGACRWLVTARIRWHALDPDRRQPGR